jgi:hypothetical protein
LRASTTEYRTTAIDHAEPLNCTFKMGHGAQDTPASESAEIPASPAAVWSAAGARCPPDADVSVLMKMAFPAEPPTSAEATREEMRDANLPLAYRDNCAHLLIPLNRCRSTTYYLPWKCEVRQMHTYLPPLEPPRPGRSLPRLEHEPNR